MPSNTHSLDLELSSSQSASIADGSQTGLDITGDISMECWFKPESQPSSSDMTLMAKWNTADISYRFTYFENAGTGLLFEFRDAGGNSSLFTYATTLSNATWYHVAVTGDVSVPSCVFYVNAFGAAGSAAASAATSIKNSAGDFAIGKLGSLNIQYLDGLVNNARIWSDIRTPTEIALNYKKVLTTGDNLQGSWYNTSSHNDLTSNNNDLTANNAPVFTTDVPFRTGGFVTIY